MEREFRIPESTDLDPVLLDVRDDEDFVGVSGRLLANVLDGDAEVVREIYELSLGELVLAKDNDAMIDDRLVDLVHSCRSEGLRYVHSMDCCTNCA